MAANAVGGLGGYNLLQQQQQQFQIQLQQRGQQPQRKSFFAPYLPQASLLPLLAAGELVVGIFRVNKRNCSDAYAAAEVLGADIYVCGSKGRNRALKGNIVAVELLDVDGAWRTKKEKEAKKRKKEENAAYGTRAVSIRKNDKKKGGVEVEGQGPVLFMMRGARYFLLRFYAHISPFILSRATDKVKPQIAGRVVAVAWPTFLGNIGPALTFIRSHQREAGSRAP